MQISIMTTIWLGARVRIFIMTILVELHGQSIIVVMEGWISSLVHLSFTRLFMIILIRTIRL